MITVAVLNQLFLGRCWTTSDLILNCNYFSFSSLDAVWNAKGYVKIVILDAMKKVFLNLIEKITTILKADNGLESVFYKFSRIPDVHNRVNEV